MGCMYNGTLVAQSQVEPLKHRKTNKMLSKCDPIAFMRTNIGNCSINSTLILNGKWVTELRSSSGDLIECGITLAGENNSGVALEQMREYYNTLITKCFKGEY